MANIAWPRTQEDYTRLAEALAELVGGRKDVVARFYDFTKDDKRLTGWAPWKGKRVKKDYEPQACELVEERTNRDTSRPEYWLLKPLSIDNLIVHLRGRERLGVYVLDHEARVSFLAADFDDHDGKLKPEAVWGEVRQFVDSCETHEWLVHVERSKSGNGYHVWLFFDEPVPAGKARAIGRWLFEESQTLRAGEDFQTFDRFFPAQSVLAPGAKGYGNLIGLPLCGKKEYTEGRTAWVHPVSRKTVADPVAYTLAILERGRNRAARVDEFMAEWDLSPEEGGSGGKGGEPVKRLDILAGVPQGGRDDAVFKYACALRAKGVAIEEARVLILQAAENCDPPFPDSQAEKCLQSAWRYPNTPRKKGGGGRSVSVDDEPPALRLVEGGPPPNEAPADLLPGEEPDGPWKGRNKARIPVHPETMMPWPPIVGGYQLESSGIRTTSNDRICLQPLWVEAITENPMSGLGLRLRFFDMNWKFKQVAVPYSLAYETGGTLSRELTNAGFGGVVPGKEKWVSRYLVQQASVCSARVRSTERLGWLDTSPPVFILPKQTIGEYSQDILYQPRHVMLASDTIFSKGDLKDWQTHVMRPCAGNPILQFCLMLSFAGPLLKFASEQSGGFHLYGTTSRGKTTAAQVCASVWGCGADPQVGPQHTFIRTWNTTGNALEGFAELHNDIALVLDEIGEVDPFELGRIIYQLCGGVSKGRATADGGMRQGRSWHLVVLSTGEHSVQQILSTAGQKQKGGQRVRLPDIPIVRDSSGARDIISDPHDMSPKDFAEALKNAAAHYYGLAGPVFVSYLVAQIKQVGLTAFIGDLKEELARVEGYLSKNLDLPPEGGRVIRRIALVAVAGMHARIAGIIDWPTEDIIKVVADIRDRWLAEQGAERSETERALSHLRAELLSKQDQFRNVASPGRAPIRDLLGYRTDDHFLVLPERMVALCGDFDARMVLSELRKREWLWNEADGRLTRKSPSIEGLGKTRPRMYWIMNDFIGESAEFTDEDRLLRTGRPISPQGQRELGDDDELPL